MDIEEPKVPDFVLENDGERTPEEQAGKGTNVENIIVYN